MSHFQPTQLDPSCVSINKTYQDVEGTFTLTNRLAITTTTGDINIELRLPPHISTRMLLEDGSQEEPPELCLTSISGSITVITPDIDSVVPTPWSNLITTICTKNGDIRAAIPHGQITDIYNYQGDVVLNLHPVEPLTPQEPTHVVVKAYKGSLDFRVYEYNKDRKGLTSEIHQIAGPAKVIMPKAWNGTAVWQDMNKRGQPTGKRQKLIEEDGEFWRGHREEGGLAAGRVTWKGAAWILDFD